MPHQNYVKAWNSLKQVEWNIIYQITSLYFSIKPLPRYKKYIKIIVLSMDQWTWNDSVNDVQDDPYIYIIYKLDVPVCFLIEDKIEKNSRMAYDLLRMIQNYHDSDYTFWTGR